MSDGFLFDFAAPVADVRTTSPTGVPVSGRTPTARRASQSGALAVGPTFSIRQRRYLQLLAQQGPLTDQAAAAALAWQLCSVNSVRAALGPDVVEAGDEAHTFVDAGGRTRTTHRTRWTLKPNS